MKKARGQTPREESARCGGEGEKEEKGLGSGAL